MLNLPLLTKLPASKSLVSNLIDIYHTKEWGELNAKKDGGIYCVFEFKNEFGKIIYPYVKRKVGKINGIQYYDLITPNGFSGPVLLNIDSNNKFLIDTFDDAFNRHCFQNRIISEYIRFNPLISNHTHFKKIFHLKFNNNTYYTNLLNGDFFLTEYSSKIRNVIRNSIKKGVEIQFDFEGETLADFYRLYHMMVTKNNVSKARILSFNYLKKSFKALQSKQFIVNAKFKGQIISSAIFLNYGKWIHYHLAANDPLYTSMNGNSNILYEVSKWGVLNNFEALHLGGGFSKELVHFKKQFSCKNKLEFFVGIKIRNKKIQSLLELRNKDQNSAFPSFLSASNFKY